MLLKLQCCSRCCRCGRCSRCSRSRCSCCSCCSRCSRCSCCSCSCSTSSSTTSSSSSSSSSSRRGGGGGSISISISRSCFCHFDFEMCFAPQRRALFPRSNLQKWSEHVVRFTFWLRHVLRATRPCTFSTSQLPKVFRTWQFFAVLTSKCASCHNGVQFFVSHLTRWLQTRRFSEPTFRPSGAPKHWKTQCFATSFSFLLFSDSSHLCFLTCPCYRSLTSKLPSVNITIIVIMKWGFYYLLYYNYNFSCYCFYW